jgi:hypothetical protein
MNDPVTRRRRKPASVNQESVEIAVLNEDENLSYGQKFSSPEERFTKWSEILATSQQAYLKLSQEIGTTNAKDPERYNLIINQLVQAHPEWQVNQLDVNDLIALLRAYKFGYGPIEDYMRIENVEDVVKVGDQINVKAIKIDEKGRLDLSRKDTLPRPEPQAKSTPTA